MTRTMKDARRRHSAASLQCDRVVQKKQVVTGECGEVYLLTGLRDNALLCPRYAEFVHDLPCNGADPYPEMFPGALGHSLAGKAMDAGSWSLDAVQIRDFTTDRHRTVDDTPAGGGAGMVLRADVLARAIDAGVTGGRSAPATADEPAW